ncbi:MAG: type II toxin-antitoxin system Phd/YefM family antitoxin [Candidatus Promineofilum sp.]|nr:type II toxin-antitoxin system Phd/YefM family antitoxin [Promineifilum sp.]MCW5865146.1 type II toxin-antitoxin system Phd/YefM family antitoxin [Anaerolineae bacterium]
MRTWQLQEAKNKLSQVVDEAIAAGPQVITRHGQEVAIVISSEDFRSLTAERESLVDFLQRSPLLGEDIDLSRDKSPIRAVFGE